MNSILRYFIVFVSFLIFIFSIFATECEAPLDSCKICSENLFSCSSTYKIKKGEQSVYCFLPDDSVPNSEFNEIIPFPHSSPKNFPYTFKVQDIKNLKGTFHNEYGGCKVIYNKEKGKLKIQFTQGQVSKFKNYCGEDTFDFSTILDISYWIKERNQDTFTELVNHKKDDVKIEFGEEHELQEKIESIRNEIEGGTQIGTFDLKVEFIIEDNKCSPKEKKEVVYRHFASTKSTEEEEKKEPRLEVLAAILHKVAHFEEVGEAQTLLSNALIDMSKLDITKVIDKSDEERTTITLTIKKTDGEELGNGDFLLFSVLPKKTTPTSKHVNFRI